VTVTLLRNIPIPDSSGGVAYWRYETAGTVNTARTGRSRRTCTREYTFEVSGYGWVTRSLTDGVAVGDGQHVDLGVIELTRLGRCAGLRRSVRT